MKVVITSPVEHDGKALAVGEVVNLPKAAALALLACGAAEADDARPVEEQGGTAVQENPPQ